MAEYRLGEIEMKFAELIWSNEPITSGELASLSLKALNWKRTTTYTVLKRLCGKGIFKNEKGVVTSLVSKQLFQAKQSEEFVEGTFGGSLPDFVAAFVSQRKLSSEEVEELKRIIEEN